MPDLLQTPILTQFNGGEFSPLMEGRVDTEGYHASARIMENLIGSIWGPALRRPGTRFIAEIKSSASAAALIPFKFSNVQAYVFEACDQAFRVYKDKGRIAVANTDAAIANGAFAAGIADWDDVSTGTGSIAHDATNGRLSLVPGGTGATDIAIAEQDVAVGASFQAVEHVLQFDVIGAPGDKIEVQVGTATGTSDVVAPQERKVGRHTLAFTPGASPVYIQFRNKGSFRNKTVQIDNVALLDNAPLEIPVPYTIAQAGGIRFAQSNDVLYLQHASVARRSLERLSHTSWRVPQVPDEDGPYLPENVTATTLTPGAFAAGTLGATLTASSTVGINNDTGFKTTDVGRSVRMNQGGTWGWAVIVGWTSTTVVTVDIRTTLTSTAAKSAWRLGLWSDTDGHPTAAVFHDQRFAAAGAAAVAGRVDLTEKGGFETWTPGTNDDDAISATLDANDASAVRWLTSGKVLLAGTTANSADVQPVVVQAAGVHRIGAPSATDVLTPSTVTAKPEDHRVLYVDRFGQTLRELRYDFVETDGYVARDLTIRSDHIAQGAGTGDQGAAAGATLDKIAFQKSPWSTCWAVRSDGQLVGVTYEAEQKVVAASRHILGGAFQGGDAVVEDVAVIPGSAGDELWMIVKRTIDGATKRYIEVLEDRFMPWTKQRYQWFVDSALMYDDPKTVVGITLADPINIEVTGHGLSVDDDVIFWDIVGTTELNGNSYKVNSVPDADHITLKNSSGTTIDGTGFGAWVKGGVVNEKVSTVSSLDHLEGETVAVLGDGAVQASKVVAGGAIALAQKAGTVIVGLAPTWKLKPQRLETGSKLGTVQTKPTFIDKLAIRFWRSGGEVKIGRDEDNTTTISFGPPPALGQAVPLFSGDKTPDFPGDNNEAGDILLFGSGPANVAILAMVPRVQYSET